MLGQSRLKTLFGQYRGHAGVFEQITQPLGWIGRIDRHIGGSALENAQERRRQVYSSFHAHADQHLCTDAFIDQIARDLVRAGIEPRIAQVLVFVYCRDSVGGCFSLNFEKLVYALREIVFSMSAVPTDEHLIALGLVEHREIANCPVRIGYDCFQQCLEVPGHSCDSRSIEEIAVVLKRDREFLADLGSHQRKIKLGNSMLQANGLELEIADHHPRSTFPQSESTR